MISYLKGRVVARLRDAIVVDVGGVGYKVFVGDNSLGEDVELYCATRLKEHTIEIYGFSSPESLELFEMVNTISGIGPKAALAISSLGSFEELQQAIREQDTTYFEKVKGLGKKKVQKVILELTGLLEAATGHGKGLEQDKQALSALVSLGFSRREAMEALFDVPGNISLEERIKMALKHVRR